MLLTYVPSYGQTAADSVPTVLAKVRRAVGYEVVKRLKYGFAVEETRESSEPKDITIKMFGPSGEARRESRPLNSGTFLFDGTELWLINRTAASARNGSPATVNQKQLEKLVLPWWVQSGWWLNENAPLDLALLPAESSGAHVALSVRFKNGAVGSKLFISRATWLPETMVVEQAKGPYTLELSDYRRALGFLYPYRLKISYDNSVNIFKIKSVTKLTNRADLFRRLPRTADTTFDNSVPAELKMAQGAPFADGSKGHSTYVRPIIDGKEVGWFHFDTGADAMMIDNRIADALKMPIIGESEVVAADGNVRKVTVRKGKTFQLGRVTINEPTYIADDLSKMNAPPGGKRAGFCGYPLLERVVAEVTGGGSGVALFDPSVYRL